MWCLMRRLKIHQSQNSHTVMIKKPSVLVPFWISVWIQLWIFGALNKHRYRYGVIALHHLKWYYVTYSLTEHMLMFTQRTLLLLDLNRSGVFLVCSIFTDQYKKTKTKRQHNTLLFPKIKEYEDPFESVLNFFLFKYDLEFQGWVP